MYIMLIRQKNKCQRIEKFFREIEVRVQNSVVSIQQQGYGIGEETDYFKESICDRKLCTIRQSRK